MMVGTNTRDQSMKFNQITMEMCIISLTYIFAL